MRSFRSLLMTMTLWSWGPLTLSGEAAPRPRRARLHSRQRNTQKKDREPTKEVVAQPRTHKYQWQLRQSHGHLSFQYEGEVNIISNKKKKLQDGLLPTNSKGLPKDELQKEESQKKNKMILRKRRGVKKITSRRVNRVQNNKINGVSNLGH